MTAAEGCNPADVLLGSAGSRAIVQASSKMTNSAFRSQPPRVTAHALHVGERINTAGFEKEALSAVPLALRAGGDGIAVLFRYGAVVFLNMTMEEEAAFLDRLLPRIGGRLMPPEEIRHRRAVGRDRGSGRLGRAGSRPRHVDGAVAGGVRRAGEKRRARP